MRLLPRRIGLHLPVRRFRCSLSTPHCATGPRNEVGVLLHARRSSNEAGSDGTYSVVIAGGGIMGCSSAYFLAQRIPASSICVVERDSKYEHASTPLSVGSIRQQFSLEENILLSRFSYDFIQNIDHHLHIKGEDPVDVQLVNSCYLFLASSGEGERTLRENYQTQRRLGADVELLTPKELRDLYPWMNVCDVALGCRGLKNEGWFDPWLYLQAFKRKVVAMGVNFVNAAVTGIDVEEGKVHSVKVSPIDGIEETMTCRHFVNACGPWSSQVALLTGIGDHTHPSHMMRVPLPVAPRRRCVFAFKCPSGSGAPEGVVPMVVDTNGSYFRSETNQNTYITGISPAKHEDHDNLPLEVDFSLFDDVLWPSLANRVPAFEAIKLQSAWAGYYDYNTLDQNGIIGAHPIITNFVFANGFSGHGIQQSPAVGRAVSEVILDGRSHSIDLSRFSFQRIIDSVPLKEKNIV